MGNRETQRKGDIGLARAIATFTEMGWDVSLPITESAAYDLIVDDGRLHRVQVRYSTGLQVELRRIHSNGQGYVVKKTVEDAYDWLYVYRPGDGEYLVKQCLAGRSTINMKEEFLLRR